MDEHKRTAGMSGLGIARRVLTIEMEALAAITKRLGPEFDDVIELLVHTRGKVVVTGMGKSGLVGQKIAATFSATGTPSVFMHAAEAFHGDFGMIAPGDVVLAVSNSGETDEIVRIIPDLKAINVKVILICGNARSSLARLADFVLDTGVQSEASAIGMVATASTTAAMAMGDALAIAVMELQGRTIADLSRLHPAGPIGEKLRALLKS